MNVIYGCIATGGSLLLLWIGAYVWAWHSNGVYGTKYDLQAWITMGREAGSFILGVLVNHSAFNTDIPWITTIIDKLKGGAKNGQ